MTTTVYTVTNDADLAADIAAIDAASQAGNGGGTTYQINIAANATLTETSALPVINLNGSDSLTIQGNGAVLNGNGQNPGFIVEGGSVTIDNMTIENAVATGTIGSPYGLGGGLFVGNGTTVTLNNVSFTNDGAVGGVAAYPTSGLAAGGDIFNQQAGTLTIAGGVIGAGTVSGGAAAAGNGIYIDSTQSITLAPAAGQTTAIYGVIADETSFYPNQTFPAASLIIDGAGTVLLEPEISPTNTAAAANTFNDGIGLESGTLELASAHAAGTGTIVFGYPTTGTPSPVLKLDAAAFTNGSFANAVTGFNYGDTIDLAGVSTNSVAYNSQTHTLTVGGDTINLSLQSGLSCANVYFATTSDGAGGTDVRLSNAPVASVISGTVGGQIVGVQKTINLFSHAVITDANVNSTDTVYIDVSSGTLADGAGFSGLTGTSVAGLYSVKAQSAAQATAEIEALVYTPAQTGSRSATGVGVQLVVQNSEGIVTSDSTTSLTVDPGPATGALSETLLEGTGINLTSAVLAAATPGIKGDTLSITAVNGSSTLGSVALVNGQLIYAASTSALAKLAASGSVNDTLGYTISDQYGDTATGTVNFKITNPVVAPTISGTAAGQIVGAQKTINPFAHVTIGDANANSTDTVYINISGGGTLSDGAGFSGLTASSVAGLYSIKAQTAAQATAEVDALVYTPAQTGSRSATTVGFQIVDQDSAGLTATNNSTTLTVDPGPATGALSETLVVGTGINLTSAVLAAATPGLKGDSLSITAVNGSSTLGSVALVNGQLIYAASTSALSHIVANGSATDSLGYTISDQYGDTATGTVAFTVTNPAVETITAGYLLGYIPVGFQTVSGNGGPDVINVGGLFNTIYANGGNDLISAGCGSDTVYAGSGSDSISFTGSCNTVSGGDGWDTVTGSTGSTNIALGNGNDTIVAGGLSNRITLGSGTNAISGGQGLETIVVGAGTDTIGLGGTLNNVTLNGSHATVSGGQGSDSVTVNGGSDNLTFAGWSSNAAINGIASVNINDLGAALTVKIGSATQNDSITGFGSSDPYGVVDLLNGAGGYASTAQIMSNLHSDGHGGTVLALGSQGSIDFAGTAASQLHASNFRIG
jgi:hypothetical protein